MRVKLVSEPIKRALEGFHNRCTRRVANLSFRYHPTTDTWERPNLEFAQDVSGIYPFEHYLQRRRRYPTEYARDNPLMTDCVQRDAVSTPATVRRRYLWDHIDLEDESHSQELQHSP